MKGHNSYYKFGKIDAGFIIMKQFWMDTGPFKTILQGFH